MKWVAVLSNAYVKEREIFPNVKHASKRETELNVDEQESNFLT